MASCTSAKFPSARPQTSNPFSNDGYAIKNPPTPTRPANLADSFSLNGGYRTSYASGGCFASVYVFDRRSVVVAVVAVVLVAVVVVAFPVASAFGVPSITGAFNTGIPASTHTSGSSACTTIASSPKSYPPCTYATNLRNREN